MKKIETIANAMLVNSFFTESTFNQTFSIMDMNNDTVVTFGEFFNTLNLVVKKAFLEESVPEVLINLSKLESKLTNTPIDIEMTLPILKLFSSLFIAGQVYFALEEFKLGPYETCDRIWEIFSQKLNDAYEGPIDSEKCVNTTAVNTFGRVKLIYPELLFDDKFYCCLSFTLIFNCMIRFYE